MMLDIKKRLKKLKIIFKNKKKNLFLKKLTYQKKKELFNIFKNYNINKVVHLAAQAGVRYSFENQESICRFKLNGIF